MNGDAILYTTGSGNDALTLYDYHLSGTRGSSGVIKDVSQDFDAAQIITDNVVQITATRSLMTSETDDKQFALGVESLTFSIAIGPDGVVDVSNDNKKHRATTSKTFDLFSGAVSSVNDFENVKIYHGVLMWAAWTVIAPFCIFVARNRQLLGKKYHKVWWPIHRFGMYSAVLLFLLAFGLAIYMVDSTHGEHFARLHMVMGLTVVILGSQQPLNALVRPPPPKEGQKPSSRRVLWTYWHRTAGLTAAILAQATAFTGMQEISANAIFLIIHILIVDLWILAFIAAEIFKCRGALLVSEVEMNQRSSSVKNVKYLEDEVDTEGPRVR